MKQIPKYEYTMVFVTGHIVDDLYVEFAEEVGHMAEEGWQIAGEVQNLFTGQYNMTISQQLKRFHPAWIEATTKEEEAFGFANRDSIVVE